MSTLFSYLLFAAMIAFVGFRWRKNRMICKKLPDYLREGADVIDVRSPEEFAAGHFPGSRNIPLGSLAEASKRLDKGRQILLCCASGTRSGVGVGLLKQKGFQSVVNAGPWQNLTAASCKDT